MNTVSIAGMLSLVAIAMVTLPFSCAEELEAATLNSMQGTFYITIMQHLAAEHELLKTAIATLNGSMQHCNDTLLPEAQQKCKTCAKGKCEGDIGDWIEAKWDVAENWFVGAGESFIGWQGWQDIGGPIVDWGGWDDMGDFLTNAWSDMSDWFSGAFSDIGDWFSGAWGDAGDWFGGAFGDIGDVFGRRRRDVGRLGMTAREFKVLMSRYMGKRVQEIDPKVRECMEKCSECQPFLGDQTDMIKGVCGEQLLLDQASMADVMTKMKALYDANGITKNGTTPILTKIEYNKATFDFDSFSFGDVKVTAKTPSGVMTYNSQYRYRMMTQQTTAVELAQELILKWAA